MKIPTLPEMPILLNPDSSGRFKVVNHPEALPNKCVSCSVSFGDEKRKFIDTTLDLDFYGVVYFCTNCFLEIANMLGFVSPEQNVGIISAFNSIQESAQRLVLENEALRSSLRDLADHRCYSSGIIHGPENIVIVDDGPGIIPEGNSENSDDGIDETSGNAKPDVIERPANVRGTAKPDSKSAKRDILSDLGL